MRIRGARAVALLLSLVRPVSAQTPAARHVTLVGDFGLVNASGNTSVTTLNAGEKLSLSRGRFTGSQTVAWVYGKTDGQTSASQIVATARAGLTVSRRVSVYASLGFERNRFAGISRRFEEGEGFAFAAIRQPRDSLALEAGIVATEQRPLTGATQTFGSGRVAGSYRHHLSARAVIYETVELLLDFNTLADLRINTETGLSAPLSRRFAIKLSYVVRFDNVPEPDFRKTDRLFTSGLQVTL